MIKEAKKISIKYNFPLVREWQGQKLFWHVWHRERLCWGLTYEQYISRIIKIDETKPQSQKQERYQLMKPVKQKFMADVELQKVDTDWQKAVDDWKKAHDDWQKADDEWQKTNHNSILQAHEKECPGCKWDGKKLPQWR